jgi:amidohydrolase
MNKIKQRIGELNKELLNLRREFHKHPELGFEEHRTAGVVENYLKNLELHPQRMTKTGVVALLEGSKPHPVLMLRADMDALPIEEESDEAYKSKNKGVMHACGHDAHMAMLLVAAKILSENKSNISGTINLSFSPMRKSPVPFT